MPEIFNYKQRGVNLNLPGGGGGGQKWPPSYFEVLEVNNAHFRIIRR